MLTSLKREIINTVCQSVGVSDPRAVAAIATMADTKFVFGSFGAEMGEDGKVVLWQEGTANGDPFKFTATLEGKITDQLKTLYFGLASGTESDGIALPASPLQPAPVGAASDFLG